MGDSAPEYIRSLLHAACEHITYYLITELMATSIITFDLRKIPHRPDIPFQGYYPVVANSQLCTTDQICQKISASSTMSPADVKGVLEALSGILSDRLSAGDRVHLEGIGYFTPELKSERAITDAEAKLVARSLKLSGVRFLPQKRLVNTLRDVAFRRTAHPLNQNLLWSDDQVVERMRRYMIETDISFVNRRQLQTVTGFSRTYCITLLKRLVANGRLLCHGAAQFPYYTIADGDEAQ